MNVYDVQQVGIMQLLYQSWTRHLPIKNYNQVVNDVNSTLKIKYKAAEQYFFWGHKGVKYGIFNNLGLSADGIHLSAAETKKYRCSIQAAIQHSLRLTHL